MKRRTFFLAGGGVLAARIASAMPPAPTKLKVAIFSKHLQFLQGQALADGAAEIGFDGVDITVRPGGHVEPERVAQDLPPLVKILRKRGLEVPMVTSGIVDADTPHAEAVLKTISGLGIRHYRWGGFRYDDGRPIPEQLDALKPRVAKLQALNKRYGVCAMYHTHSGIGQVGASIWDLYIVLKNFDPNAVAVNYDVAHATIEGGYGGWIDSLRVIGPYLKGVAVKDFLWAKDSKGNWVPQWRPLGQGMVRFPQFFGMLAQRKFSGPLQLHAEYPLGGAEDGKRKITLGRDEVVAALKRDLALLRKWMGAAGI